MNAASKSGWTAIVLLRRLPDDAPQMVDAMKIPMSLEVKGNNKQWGFTFYGDPKHLEDWLADGLIVHEVVNTIPVWVVDAGLAKPWCYAQDLFHFRVCREWWQKLKAWWTQGSRYGD